MSENAAVQTVACNIDKDRAGKAVFREADVARRPTSYRLRARGASRCAGKIQRTRRRGNG